MQFATLALVAAVSVSEVVASPHGHAHRHKHQKKEYVSPFLESISSLHNALSTPTSLSIPCTNLQKHC
jgi:hypothetical protein